ncbi:non-ribosomal peptide synthetase [Oscillatoria sp. HE19RPO]|uniref:non-ribosomal peptide synthetase n=1 Tax=Oscillatoria sp. HE19RPO TaxID=2954806 RepID=UPI0020C4A957|nr:non-ribosomal peptide synthetase [Oscillatoria sp. HE19RPO]
MNLNQFLAELAQRGIKLWLEGDTLRFRAPKGVMTPEERDLLVLHKAKIISLLSQSNTSANDTEKTIVTTSEQREIPLSFPQEQLWFLSELDPNNVSYNELFALRFLGVLNIVALEQSLNKIVARHAALRTNFATVNGQPVQVIAERLTLTVPVIDLSNLPACDRENEVQRLATEQAQKPFNLVSDPLIQGTVFKLTDTEHIFLLRTHHIVWDGWSLGVMWRELAAFYNDLSQELPPLPAQYPEFAVWQRQYLTGEVLDSLQTYWKKQLLDAPPLLELPTDRARGTTQTFRGKHYKFVISKPLSEAIIDLSRRQKVTIFMTLLSAFQTLLYRYTGQNDVVVGLPIANRDRPEFEGLIGFFVNTLVLRTCFSGNPSFEDLLSKVRKVTLGAYAHRDLPFEKLVEILQPERSVIYTPLVQVMLVILDELPEIQIEGLRVSPLAVETGIARTDLALCVEKTACGLIGEWEYNTDLFDESTIARMSRHFQTLLEGIVVNSKQKISELPLLTETERQQIHVEWNNTWAEYPQDKCIHQLFEAQVEQSPDAVALVFEGEQLTYRELNAKANQLAHYLQNLGVGPEVLVGICVERSFDMVVGILGVLKAGGVYVPLDPTYPQERLGFMLEDSSVSVLLTQTQLVELLPPSSARVVCVDGDIEKIAFHSSENASSTVTPDNLAYVIYTSGSTGKPKGVLLAHQGLCNLVTAQIQLFDVHSDSRILQFASLSFDASIWEVVMALISGATLVLALRESLMPGPALIELLRDYAITTATLPPSVLAVLPPEEFPALQTIIVAGEACSADLVARWALGRQFFNAYGPTEATVCATVALCSDGSRKPPIGRPIANTQIYILDPHNQPVPIGVPGELHIAGVGLAKGYLNRPELTDEKFIPNPFSNEPDSRLYKTGDLARYLSDGNIEYLGRIDDQVKVRGFRIELGEIEAALSQHPSLLSAAVVLREDIPGQKSLVAYIVPVQDSAPTVGELRGFLKPQLPDYMMPSAFVVLESLPLTPNGKVDRRALPAPEKRNELEESFVAPSTPIEEMLASIWSNILSIDSVGIHDNFFELGGHSLLATQVISRVRDTLTVELPLRTLFEAPTLAGLAERVENSLKNGQSVEPLPLVPISRSESIPLSFAQARLWFLDQLQPNSSFYNIPLALHLSGQLNIAALESSINEIIQRHEALRTNFVAVEGQPVQVITSTFNFQVQSVNLLHLPENERKIEAQQLATVEANRPFNLEREPLFRVTLLQLDQTEYVLLFTMHHIISDGWSLGILLKELRELYKGFCTGKPVNLPSLPVQYADFAVWQRQWLSGEILETQLGYWKEKLSDAPTLLELPTDRPRPAVQTFRGGYYHTVLPQELSAELTALTKRVGVTLFMTLLAAFQTLLYRLSGQDDIVVGTPVGGRNRQEIEGLIGFFVNSLVLRTDLSGNPSFEQLLGKVREVALQAYTHQDLPFEQLVEALHPTRDLSYTPLFQAMFSLDDDLMPVMELPELSISSYPVEMGTAKFDLGLSMENTASGLVAEWEYSTDLFDESTIARIARNFQTLLESIVVNSKQKISELSLLTETERHQLHVQWNNTRAEYPQDKCIHQLFEAQVELMPDAVAVVFEGERLTYQELNAKANQLAYYLQSLGVKPEVLVGICVERSVEMVIGLWGVLKAGGAYVPLDPNYPSERLAFMLQDSSVPVLLTQQKLVDKLPPNSTRVVCLDSGWEKIAAYSENNPNSAVRPQNLAYVIYTSGSTGKPKGVLIEHRSLVNYTIVASAEYGIQERDRILQFSSISFDVSAEEIYTSLTSGATLVLGTDSMLDSLKGFLQKCNDWEITVLALPTAYWHELTTFLSQEKVALPPSLRLIIIGGEKALAERLKTWFECVGQRVRLVNNYGPTETTVGATICELSAADATLRELPIGRPIGNVQTYILDENRQPLPIGVPGELYIGGAGLARGYLNRPELTDERFIPNPFSDSPSDRLYKTGDLVRYLADSNIEYVGRIDNQIKIRGFRIELEEIEAVLSQHPNVREVAVIDREDTPGNKRLVAYMVSNLIPGRIPYHTKCQLELDGNAIAIETQDISTGGVGLVGVPVLDEGNNVHLHLQLPGEDEPRWLSGTVVWSHSSQAGIQFHLTPSERALVDRSVAYQLETQELWKTLQRTVTRNLRDYLKQKLPDYMIPSVFVLLEAMPLTPNGKIDRRALPAPDSFNPQNESCFVAPHDTLELQLSQIWSEVLGVHPVGVRDNFFTLGGHSLLAVRLMARLEQQLGINLPLATLFSSPTIEQLVIHLRSSRDSGKWSPLIPIQSIGHKQPFFCVPGIGGNVLYFYELARHLGADQPFYGLQARGLNGELEPFTRVEDMAACYIEAIQTVQSKGPYLLGGHSFGGVVAFEMAQQLQKQEHEVALVAIIDTLAPTLISEQVIDVNEDELDFNEFATYLGYMFYPKAQLLSNALDHLTLQEKLNFLNQKWSKINFIDSDKYNQHFMDLWKVYKASKKAHCNYFPEQVFPTPISIFQARTTNVEVSMNKGKSLLEDSALGWRKFSDCTTTYIIPGNHMNILQEPYVKILSEKLKISLNSREFT